MSHQKAHSSDDNWKEKEEQVNISAKHPREGQYAGSEPRLLVDGLHEISKKGSLKGLFPVTVEIYRILSEMGFFLLIAFIGKVDSRI
ncbi:MAG: hypothetical protein IAF58_14785 [Leptolyngbya sp.]|nr:hypothetical protein [Candidatus Melainabacteria bacterium]